MHDIDGAIALVDSGVLLLFLSVAHAFVSDVRLFSVFQDSQFGYGQAYPDYHRSLDAVWNDGAGVG